MEKGKGNVQILEMQMANQFSAKKEKLRDGRNILKPSMMAQNLTYWKEKVRSTMMIWEISY